MGSYSLSLAQTDQLLFVEKLLSSTVDVLVDVDCQAENSSKTAISSWVGNSKKLRYGRLSASITPTRREKT